MRANRSGSQQIHFTQKSKSSDCANTNSRFQHTRSRRQFLIQAGQVATAVVLGGCALAQPIEPIQELAGNFIIPELVTGENDSLGTPPLPEAISPALGSTSTPLDVKIGQMILAGFSGQQLGPGSSIMQDVAQNRVGSVALFGRNIVNAAQLSQLTASLQSVAEIPLLISVDQEGGQVSRVGSHFGLPTNYSAAELGRLNDPVATQTYAETTAKMLRMLGINLNLAPVVDLNTNPANPVIGAQGRSFSHDPYVVTEQALAFIQAHHQEGVLCTLKHFPGHGSSTADSHHGFVDVTETWSADELTPFATIIQSGRCDAVMTAHIFNANLDDEYPATLSNRVITGILRERLGYDGVIMTDDIQMGAIRNFYAFDKAIELALNAGVDIFSISRYSPALVNLVFATIHDLIDSGRVTEERIDSSFRRVVALKSRLIAPEPEVVEGTPQDVELEGTQPIEVGPMQPIGQPPSTVTPEPTATPTSLAAPASGPTFTPTPDTAPKIMIPPTPVEKSEFKEPEYMEKLDSFLH